MHFFLSGLPRLLPGLSRAPTWEALPLSIADEPSFWFCPIVFFFSPFSTIFFPLPFFSRIFRVYWSSLTLIRFFSIFVILFCFFPICSGFFSCVFFAVFFCRGHLILTFWLVVRITGSAKCVIAPSAVAESQHAYVLCRRASTAALGFQKEQNTFLFVSIFHEHWALFISESSVAPKMMHHWSAPFTFFSTIIYLVSERSGRSARYAERLEYIYNCM